MSDKMASKKDNEAKECEVKGCTNEAVRSVGAKKIAKSDLAIDSKRGNVHLCKDHYRQFKKSTKEDRKLERLGW